MVPGRGDRLAMSVAVRRTCGAENELEKGKIGRGRCVQTQTTKKETHHRHTNLNLDEYESESRSSSSTGGMHDARTMYKRMQWSDTRSILLLCRAATSPTVLSEGLFAGLKDGVAQQQLIVCQMTRQRRRQATRTWFRGRRRRSPLACVRQGRCQKTPTFTLLADVLTASPAWGFFSLETMYFELLFEVLALTFRSTCKTGGRC